MNRPTCIRGNRIARKSHRGLPKRPSVCHGGGDEKTMAPDQRGALAQRGVTATSPSFAASAGARASGRPRRRGDRLRSQPGAAEQDQRGDSDMRDPGDRHRTIVFDRSGPGPGVPDRARFAPHPVFSRACSNDATSAAPAGGQWAMKVGVHVRHGMVEPARGTMIDLDFPSGCPNSRVPRYTDRR